MLDISILILPASFKASYIFVHNSIHNGENNSSKYSFRFKIPVNLKFVI